MCLAYFVDFLSLVVCTTRFWQTTGRLVQEFYVCTVACSWDVAVAKAGPDVSGTAPGKGQLSSSSSSSSSGGRPVGD